MANITVDELIKEYVVYRAENDYKTKLTISEFMNFLEYFKKEMKVEDTLDDGLEMFTRFFAREDKHRYNYSPYFDKVNNEKAKSNELAMILEFSEEDNDYVLRTGNYLYSSYGASSWHVYWNIEKARRIMGEYLINEPKRTLDDNGPYDTEGLEIGKYVSAKIVEDIWNELVDYYVENRQWPNACRDINKYLLEMDLAPIICIDSFRDRLLELYSVFSRRIAILYNQDKDLFISYSGSLVGEQNYKLLINGFERLVGCAYGEYKKHLEVDIKNLTITKSYEDGASYWDSSAPVRTINNKINSDRIIKLSSDLDNILKKKQKENKGNIKVKKLVNKK